MNWKKTLLFALVLAALGSYLYWIELPQEKAAEAREYVFNTATQQIKRVHVRGGDAGEYAIENSEPMLEGKRGEGLDLAALQKWRLVDVSYNQLDTATLNSLLSGIMEFKPGKALPDEDLSSDLSIYGLDKPALTLDVQHQAGSNTILFGKTNEYVHKRYAKLGDGAQVYLVPEQLYSSANKKVFELRKKTPVEFFDSEVKALTFKSKDGEFRLEKKSDQKRKEYWQIVKPATFSASESVVSDVLREVRNLKASEILDQESKDANGLKNPSLSMSVEFIEATKREPLSIALVPKNDAASGIYFTLSNISAVFVADTNPLTALARSLDAFREKELFKFEVGSVQGVSLSGSEQETIEVKKHDQGWKVGDEPGDTPFVDELLKSLSTLSAASFPSSTGDLGFSKPRLKVIVRMLDSEKKESETTLVVGSPVTDHGKAKQPREYYAAANALDEPFIISEESLRRISPKREALVHVPTPTPSASAVASLIPVPVEE